MTNKEKWLNRVSIEIPLMVSAVCVGLSPIALLVGCIMNDIAYSLLAMIGLVAIIGVVSIICKIIEVILKKSIDKENNL